MSQIDNNNKKQLNLDSFVSALSPLEETIQQCTHSINASCRCDNMYTYTLFHKKGATYFRHNSRISWSVFIIFTLMETGINTLQYHVIYLLSCLMTSQDWHFKNHDSLTVVYMLKLTILNTVFHKKWTTYFRRTSRISWSIFIIFALMETGMNTLQYHVIYLLNCLMTS